MRYKIGDLVTVIKTNEIKTIIDCEIISNVELYYMSDSTAYPSHELTKFKNLNSKEELEKKLLDNKELIINLIDYEKRIKNWSDWLLKNSNNKSPNLIGSTSGQTSIPFFTRFCKWIGFTSFQRI